MLPFICGQRSAASLQLQNAAVIPLKRSPEPSSRRLLIFLIPGVGFPEQMRSKNG